MRIQWPTRNPLYHRPMLPEITRPSGPGNVFDETAQRIVKEANDGAAKINSPATDVPLPSFLRTTKKGDEAPE